MADRIDIDPAALGPNMWLIDEMYRRYREDPDGVGEGWKEFFEDLTPRLGDAQGADGGMPAPPAPQPARESPAPAAVPEGAARLRFGAERIARNMEASLEIPTATSFRFIPAKLLEENRRVVNRFLAASRGGGKVSFTHLVGWAILRALEAVPVMKSSFREVDGEPYVIRSQVVNLGLAVDVEEGDG